MHSNWIFLLRGHFHWCRRHWLWFLLGQGFDMRRQCYFEYHLNWCGWKGAAAFHWEDGRDGYTEPANGGDDPTQKRRDWSQPPSLSIHLINTLGWGSEKDKMGLEGEASFIHCWWEVRKVTWVKNFNHSVNLAKTPETATTRVTEYTHRGILLDMLTHSKRVSKKTERERNNGGHVSPGSQVVHPNPFLT